MPQVLAAFHEPDFRHGFRKRLLPSVQVKGYEAHRDGESRPACITLCGKPAYQIMEGYEPR